MARLTVVIACFIAMFGLTMAQAGVQDFQHPATGTSNFVVSSTHQLLRLWRTGLLPGWRVLDR